MNSLLHAEEEFNESSIPGSVKLAWWLEGLLLTFGFVCLCWVGSSYGRAWFYQSYESYALEQTVHGGNAHFLGWVSYAALGKRPELPIPVVPPAPAEGMQAVSPDGLIGRIEMPRLNVSAVVREGVDEKTLSQAVGHVPYTALPGQTGNFSVAAHRDTFFRGLRNVRTGDLIRVLTTSGEYEYVVDLLKIVKPGNVEVLDKTPFAAITLVTCYPFNFVGSAPKRFIVRGRLVR